MQVGLSQIMVGDRSMGDFFRDAKEAGYEVIELTLKPEGKGELTLGTTPAGLDAIRQGAAGAGLELVSMAHLQCTGNLLAGGELQQTSLEETRAGLRIAARLGIRTTLHTLGRLRPDVYYDEAYNHAVASLKTLARDCEALGVSIAVEFIWNGFAFSPLEMKRLLDEVGSPMIGFYFDPGNMAVFQTPHHWVRILGRHIKMVHMKDWQGGALSGGWPALLKGRVDFPAVMGELRNIGYDGPLISEVSLTEATHKESADAIRKIMAM